MQPETRLWRCVIARALADASAPERPVVATGDSAPTDAERDRARRWLLGNSRNIRDVCLMADVDPDALRSAAERHFTAGENHAR